jgi:hypothetical protein
MTYPWNARCKGMFGSFTIGKIRTSDGQHGYSVFPARLSPAIFGTCPEIKHPWPKSEARWHNNDVGISLHGSSDLGGLRIIDCINASGLRTNAPTLAVFVDELKNLARMLITLEHEGEYTEEQKE